ncbi:uncharacterized protein MELLADRAFT_113130 [Melampsora larici-populina 98AG31]|uniref:Uncharacterized protein n=1 Tax=Melampsora larici-populina (strain 98AG31 / pathotype 3-4-7) TaxID=747676 RepID=F4S8V4_MELLP|nr:uncharacterized protein MELLADRAFT_113130 [Melampsora larici-populina 98AG31]EGF98871.1 hypothetical protein MELLADRAFT_113130 [Melampsora larici-populina 98AG31]
MLSRVIDQVVHYCSFDNYSNPSSLLVTVMAKGKKKSNPNSPTTQTPLHIITTRSNATTQDLSKSDAPESKAAPATASVDPSHAQSIPAAVPLFGHTTTSSTPNIANITALVQSQGNGVAALTCRECHLGHYIDANGTLQRGVEVAPETQEAHALLDRRALARSHNQRTSPSVSSHTSPVLTRRTSTAHDVDLSSRFSHLGIATLNSRSNDQSMLAQPHFTEQEFPANEQQGSPLSSVERESLDETPANINVDDHVPYASTEAKTCTAAILARYSGVQDYNCGDYQSLQSLFG